MPFQNSALFYFAGTQTTVITQLTREQAIACFQNEHWKEWGPLTQALFQLHQEFLCMPFSVFHEAVKKTLGRPVFTHEFSTAGFERLRAEILGLADAASLHEIITDVSTF
jgi:hypothetical protein